jgi:hypothetical protein
MVQAIVIAPLMAVFQPRATIVIVGTSEAQK